MACTKTSNLKLRPLQIQILFVHLGFFSNTHTGPMVSKKNLTYIYCICIYQLPLLTFRYTAELCVWWGISSVSAENMRKQQAGKCQSTWQGTTCGSIYRRSSRKVLRGLYFTFFYFTSFHQGKQNGSLGAITVTGARGGQQANWSQVHEQLNEVLLFSLRMNIYTSFIQSIIILLPGMF